MNTVDIDRFEWWSNCCDAPPLHELHNAYEDAEPEGKVLGMCMKCREGAVFYLIEPTIEELKKQHDEAMASIAETRAEEDL